MITGKLIYFGMTYDNAVGRVSRISSINQNDTAIEWNAYVEIFLNEESIASNNPVETYPMLGWIDNTRLLIPALDAMAIDNFKKDWSVVS